MHNLLRKYYSDSKSIFLNIFILAFFVVAVFIPAYTEAAVLLPGNISTCGELAAPGTYTLTSDLNGGADVCLTISSDNVTITGGGHTITGSGETAIDARARTGGSGGALTDGANGYTNIILNDLNISGYTIGLNASGNSDTTGEGQKNGFGGDAGDVAVFYSYIGSITLNGGSSQTKQYGGLGGNLAFTDTDLNISSSTISLLGGTGLTGRYTDGGLSVTHTGTFNYENVTLSSLSSLKDNSEIIASLSNPYTGGAWPIVPGNVDHCGTLFGSGTYTLTTDLTNIDGTCFTSSSRTIFFNGNEHTISSASSTDTRYAFNARAVESLEIASTTISGYINSVDVSASSLIISGHNIDLHNQHINAGSITINYSGTLNKSGLTSGGVNSLVVNGVDYNSVVNGPLLDWVLTGADQADWREIETSLTGQKVYALQNAVGQVRISGDYGGNWSLKGPIGTWRGISSSIDGTRLVLVGVSEQIYTSADSGESWIARGNSAVWIDVASSANGKYLVAVSSAAVKYSTDYGVTWNSGTAITSPTSITSSATGDLLIAGTSGGYIYTSSNHGVSWTQRAISENWDKVSVSGDGIKAVANTESGDVYVSNDGGVTWSETNRPVYLGVATVGITYDGKKLYSIGLSDPVSHISTNLGQNWSIDNTSNFLWSLVASNSDGETKYLAMSGSRIYRRDKTRTLEVTIINPASNGAVTSWAPIVSWGSAAHCYYSYNNFNSTSTANCSQLGSDISNPGYGPRTLYIKGIDSNGVIDIDSISYVSELPITVDSPVAETSVTSWTPSINWDPNNGGNITNCYYSYDNFTSTSTANCSDDGGDILPPTLPGSATLYLKVLNAGGNMGTKQISFMYSPSWVSRAINANWKSIAVSTNGTKAVAAAASGYIYTTADSGKTWTARDSVRNWSGVTSDSAGTKLAAAVTSGYIYTSINSGLSWTQRATSRNWTSIASNNTGATLYASVVNGYIYRSTDSGVTWATSTSAGSRAWLSLAVSDGGTRVIAAPSSGYLYMSNDSGSTWATTTSAGSKSWEAVSMASDGNEIIALGNNDVYYSNDYGASWNMVFDGVNPNAIALAKGGGAMAVAEYGGSVYVSDNHGVTWKKYESSRGWNCLGIANTYVYENPGYKVYAGVYGGTIYTYDKDSNVSVVRPVNSSSALYRSWNTLINWGSSTSCYYSYDNFTSTSTSNCGSAGSDISRPSVRGLNTLFIKGIDSLNNVSESASQFEYEPWTKKLTTKSWDNVAVSSDGRYILAGPTSGYLYVSNDYGVTWATSTGPGSRGWSGVAMSSSGSRMVAVASSAQVYVSSDYGVTWQAKGASRGWNSVACSSDCTYIVASVSNNYIFTSPDFGESWSQRSGPAYWDSVAMSSTGQYMLASIWTYGGNLYVSSDYGVSWLPKDSLRAWRGVAMSADGSKMVAVQSDNVSNVPGRIYVSSNYGSNWSPVGPTAYWYGVTSSADGTKLAAVDERGQIYISNDSGSTWTAQESNRAWRGIASNSDGKMLVGGASSDYLYISRSQPYVTSPAASSSVALWSPVVDWDRSTTCSYSWDNSNWNNVSCLNAGSDISASSNFGSTTLYIKGVDFENNVATSSVSFFNYSSFSLNTISSCGSINSAGTYTLLNDISNVSGVCLYVNADNVIIDGGGHTISAVNGNTSYTISAGSHNDLTLNNIKSSGFVGLIQSTGNLTYSGDNIDLSNSTTSVSSLRINYTNSLTTSNTRLSSLTSFFIKGLDLFNFVGGIFNWLTQDINSCGTISSPGYYNLTANISNISGTCFSIQSDYVIIDGNNHIITGTGGNNSYAIVATSTNPASSPSAHTSIAIKDLTINSFGGGVDASGFNGNESLDIYNGGNGGNISLNGVNISVSEISVNTSGGVGVWYVSGGVPGNGGNAGNIKLENSNVGDLILNGGSTNGNPNLMSNIGVISGGSAGTVTQTNSVKGTVQAVQGTDYSPGCTDSSNPNYDSTATYNDGSCAFLNIGTEVDNPAGNTVNGDYTFWGYSNRGTIYGNGTFYTENIYSDAVSNVGNYGTTTGFGSFYSSSIGIPVYNYGYVGGGAYLLNTVNQGIIDGGNGTSVTLDSNSLNYGVITANSIIFSGEGITNYGTLNGNVDFSASNASSNQNYGTVNGDAHFYYSTDNHGTVNGTASYYLGCSDSNANNYIGPVEYDDGSCTYIGTNIDNPLDNTIYGPVNFSGCTNNYGTIEGDAVFQPCSHNYGVVTGNAIFEEYFADNGTLYVNDDFNNGFMGTGVVNGNIYDGSYTYIPITLVQFGNSFMNDYTVQTNVNFLENSRNNSNGVIRGLAYFSDYSYNYGHVIGDATFNGLYYASTTPTGGVLNIENDGWSGLIDGSILGGDLQVINKLFFYNSTYNNYTGTLNADTVFNNNSVNNGVIQGDSVFNDNSANTNNIIGNVILNSSSTNSGNIVGDLTINTSAYNPNEPILPNSTTTLIIGTGSGWWGSVSGNIYSPDGVTKITNFDFRGNSANHGTINNNARFFDETFNLSTINGDVEFYNYSNNGSSLITGNALFDLQSNSFGIGSVTGTVTLRGTNKTITGSNNTIGNLVKISTGRDTLYFDSGATLNVTGNTTIRGLDSNNLLSLRSMDPNNSYYLNLQGAIDINYVRIRDAYSLHGIIDLSSKNVFNDGHNSLIIFPSNSSVDSRGGITGSYSAPSLPVSRGGTGNTSGTNTGTNNTNNLTGSAGATAFGGFFNSNYKNLEFNKLQNFNVFDKNYSGSNIGNTKLYNPLQNLSSPGKVELSKLPLNFLKNISNFLTSFNGENAGIGINFESAGKLINLYGLQKLNPKDSDYSKKLEQIVSNLINHPIPLKISDYDNEGIYLVKTKGAIIPANLSYSSSFGGLIEVINSETNKDLDVYISGKGGSAKYLDMTIPLAEKGNKYVAYIRTPAKSGTYSFRASSSPIPLVIKVAEVPLGNDKKGWNLVDWIKKLFK